MVVSDGKAERIGPFGVRQDFLCGTAEHCVFSKILHAKCLSNLSGIVLELHQVCSHIICANAGGDFPVDIIVGQFLIDQQWFN